MLMLRYAASRGIRNNVLVVASTTDRRPSRTSIDEQAGSRSEGSIPWTSRRLRACCQESGCLRSKRGPTRISIFSSKTAPGWSSRRSEDDWPSAWRRTAALEGVRSGCGRRLVSEYLEFIAKYIGRFGRSPAESDIQRHFFGFGTFRESHGAGAGAKRIYPAAAGHASVDSRCRPGCVCRVWRYASSEESEVAQPDPPKSVSRSLARSPGERGAGRAERSRFLSGQGHARVLSRRELGRLSDHSPRNSKGRHNTGLQPAAPAAIMRAPRLKPKRSASLKRVRTSKMPIPPGRRRESST